MKSVSKSLAKNTKQLTNAASLKAPSLNAASLTGDANLLESAVAFRKAAKVYTQQAVKTKASAIKTLHREGILTKKGRLAKAYA